MRPPSSLQELVQPREAFFGRIDRAVDEWLLVVLAGRESAQGDDQVVEVEHGAARVDGQHAARRRFGPGFGRAGDDDVARLRIAEDVLDAGEAGQMLHGIVDRLAVGDAFLDDALESRERNFAKLARLGDVAIEPRERFLNALSREIAGRIVFHDAAEDAVGIDRDTGRCAAADRVALPPTQIAEQPASTTGKRRAPEAGACGA